MKINPEWTSAQHLPELYRELKTLDLLENVAELEAFGYTVIPPDKVGTPQEHQAVRDAVLDVACERKQCSEDELAEVFGNQQELLRFILWDNQIFERTLLNPAGFGLVQYLLGTGCILSLCDCWVKGAGESRTNIHADWAQFEIVTFQPEPNTANINYLLSDYTKDDGALSFVPGSHRWRRLPSREESEYWLDHAQPVEAPMGSMVIFGDHVWHGSYPRKNDGLRLMFLGTFARPHMQTQEPFRGTVTQEALDRNPLRFGQLMDIRGSFPFGKSPPRPRPGQKPYQIPAYLSLFDREPANGKLQLRQETDFSVYDTEFMHEINERSKGRTIRFPDFYRSKRD